MFSKFLTTLFCTAALVISAHPLVDFVREKHLDTEEGRISFLTERLVPYITEADLLHQKIQSLSHEANALSPENDQPKILEIAQKMTEEMAKLSPMLVTLEQCMYLEGDLEQIDVILQNSDSLSSEQEEILQRIQMIYQAVS